MADDTRDTKQSHPAGPPPGATEPPEHVRQPKVYEIFEAPASANALPAGYGQNTAGGEAAEAEFGGGSKNGQSGGFQERAYVPVCARESDDGDWWGFCNGRDEDVVWQ